ncbi:MAG: outer membrane lipoprotein chaperone LolA [Desulfovermiculus sp.]|nr:outer membrane lipoprotein chaperone LolA [Desulfovermiculus sp.]
MFRQAIAICILIVSLLVFWHSSPASAQEIADTIQKQYAQVESFQTKFRQTLTNAASGETEERRGTIWYQKPELIRWQTTHPEEELLVSTGDMVWDFFPEEKVAYKYSLQGRFDSKTMLKFISGQVNLEDDFRIKNLGADSNHSDWTKIQLVPKNPEPSLVMAHIWVEAQTHLIRQVLLEDFFGNTNQLTFDHIQLDVDMDPCLFTFDPPAEVEVLEGN